MPESRTWRSVVDVGCLAILAASLAGGICGTTIVAAWGLSQTPEGLGLASLWQVPFAGLCYGLVVSPVVGVGLVLFGIPLTWLMGDWLPSRLAWLFVIVGIAVSGGIFLTMLSALFGLNRPDQDQLFWLVAFSLPYCIPAGIVWWLFIRRAARGLEHHA